MVGYLAITFCKFANECVSEKNCDNRLTFGKVTGKSMVSCFFGTSTYLPSTYNQIVNHRRLLDEYDVSACTVSFLLWKNTE